MVPGCEAIMSPCCGCSWALNEQTESYFCLGCGEPAPASASDGNSEQMTDTVQATSNARTVNNTMRHAYRVLTDAEKAQMQAIKDKGLELHALIEGIGGSRELSIAKTKTEEAVMWAVKHITA